MKPKHLLLLLLVAAFSSCSIAYRTGQTPDDVYYSPAPPPSNDYVTTDNQQDRDKYAYDNTYNSEDLAIRRGINNRRYRSNISLDFGYGYNPYDHYGSSFYNPYSSYYNPYGYSGITFYPYNHNYYNSYYSPYYDYYYPPVYYVPKPGNGVSNTRGPRQYNLGVYNRSNTSRVYNHREQATTNSSAPVRTFTTQSSNRSGVGNFIRRVLTPSNNNRSYSDDNSNNYSSPSRTTNSSGSSSSSSSSGSSPVRTFRK